MLKLISRCALAVAIAHSITLAHAHDTVTSAISGVVAAGTKVELIKEGFTGTEGPLALPNGDFIFTETQANRITKIAADGSISTFLENTNGSNGLGFNAKGELITVQVLETKVGVIYPQDKSRVLANSFEGKVFGRPNDLVVDKKGGVYFTDSGSNPQQNAQPPAARSDGLPTSPTATPAVYHISPDGKLQRIADDIGRPNGIQLSPDEKTLYVANTNGEYALAYDIDSNGNVKNRRDFAKLAGFDPQSTFYPKDNTTPNSGADGLAVDKDGRLFVASNSGVEVFSSKGESLGVIPVPKKPQNIAFAGADKKMLYIVGRGAAYKLATQTAGFKGRAK
ncbi:MAG: SMP-30/gluconolactonase/LRE family protein [Spongiibacteraceae bacterium]